MATKNTTSSCVISFDNPNKIYFSGEILSGQILLRLLEEKLIRGISMNISGKAYCSWNKTRKSKPTPSTSSASSKSSASPSSPPSSSSSTSSSTYTGKENYLNEKLQLFDGRAGPLKFPPGMYSYPFQLVLPHDLPTSAKGKFGFIRYSARANVDLPMRRDLSVKEEFTIIKPMQLNLFPLLKCPVELVKKDSFFWCCLFCFCRSNHLYLIGRIPISGFCPGETIPLELRVINGSDQPIRNFKVKLTRILTYQPYKKKPKIIQSDSTDLHVITRHGCKTNSNEQYHINIPVPDTVPTDVSSYICKIEYAIMIIGSAGCCHTNPIMKIPITIGTLPFIENNLNDVNEFNEIESPGSPQPPLPPLPSTMTMPYVDQQHQQQQYLFTTPLNAITEQYPPTMYYNDPLMTTSMTYL